MQFLEKDIRKQYINNSLNAMHMEVNIMQMDSLTAVDFDKKVVAKEPAVAVQTAAPSRESTKVSESNRNGEKREDQKGNPFGKEKQPAQSSMDAAMSLLNSQIAKTHCAYAYDEVTKRVSIKVFDDETDELIREVPPEKSLEALKKMWEIAGIIIDEKR